MNIKDLLYLFFIYTGGLLTALLGVRVNIYYMDTVEANMQCSLKGEFNYIEVGIPYTYVICGDGSRIKLKEK